MIKQQPIRSNGTDDSGSPSSSSRSHPYKFTINDQHPTLKECIVNSLLQSTGSPSSVLLV